MLDKPLTAQQAADFLQIHINTLYRYIDEGRLKAVKIGGLLRINEADLKEFLSQSPKERRDATTDTRQGTTPKSDLSSSKTYSKFSDSF